MDKRKNKHSLSKITRNKFRFTFFQSNLRIQLFHSEAQSLFANRTSSSDVSEEYVSLKPLISMELNVVVTCQAEVENRTFSSSALINVGELILVHLIGV